MTNERSSTSASPEPAGNSRLYYGYIVVLCSFLILVIVFGTNYSFGIFFNRLLEDLQWSRAITSTAYSIAQFIGGAAGILTGRFSDKLGPRKVILGCGLFMITGCFLVSLVNEPWQLYLIYGLTGIGFGGAMIPLASTVSRWFIKRRGLMTGIAISGVGAGTMLMPLIANQFLQALDWRLSFIALGGLAAVVIVPAALFLKRDPSRMGIQTHSAKDGKHLTGFDKETGLTFREAIRTPQFWITCLIFTLFGFYLQAIIVHIVPHAKSLDLDPAGAAFIMTFIGGGSILGRIVMGNASDRIGVKYTLIIALTLITLSFIWLLMSGSLWSLYLFALVFGFGYGTIIAMQTLSMASMFGLISLGTLAGVATFVYTVGGAVGATLTGYLYDISDSYRPAFYIFTAFAATGLALAFFLRPVRKKGKP